ncbi:MAG: hypothetical protein ACRD4G_01405, partial [Bryobacteraceae bacterium]
MRAAPVSSSASARIAEAKKLERSGQFSAALQAFGLAARQARKSQNRKLEAQALVSVAVCHMRLFHYRAGVEAAERARQLALDLSDYAIAGRASGDLATAYS